MNLQHYLDLDPVEPSGPWDAVGSMFNSQKWIRFMSVLGFIVGAFESILVIITTFYGLGIGVFFGN